MRGPIAAAAAVALMCACGVGSPWFKTTDRYWREIHEDYIAKHPETTEEVRRAIRAEEVVMGMIELEVVAAIGKPRDINRTTTAYGTTAQFVYADPAFYPVKPKYSYVYFENGRVTSWQQ